MPSLSARLRACLPRLPSSGSSNGSVISTASGTAGTSLTFQYVSDLHLEYCSQYTAFRLPAHASNLILAGNTGRLADYGLFLDFLADLAPRFKRILLVLGATELHGLSRKEAQQLAERLVSESVLRGRVVLLDQTRVDLNMNVTVLGCTLFSHIDSRHFDAITAAAATGRSGSFAQLSDWSVEAHVEAHNAQREWLSLEIESIRSENSGNHKILVVTSTSPVCCSQSTSIDDKSVISLSSFSSLSSIPQLLPPSLSSTTETQLLGSDSSLDQATCWVFGSNGTIVDSNLAGLRLLSNQRGLVAPFEDSNTAFTREVNTGRARGRGAGLRSKSSRMAGVFDVSRTFRV